MPSPLFARPLRCRCRCRQSPHETLFLESTNDIRLRDISTSALVQFQLLDFPGHFDFSDRKSRVSAERVFKKPGALVFVIDAQDDENQFSEAIDYFLQMAKIAYKLNPKIAFDVLIHKVDGDAYLSDDHKTGEFASDSKRRQTTITTAAADRIRAAAMSSGQRSLVLFPLFARPSVSSPSSPRSPHSVP